MNGIPHLLDLQGWKIRRGQIIRTFSFGKVSDVVRFLVDVIAIGRSQGLPPKVVLGFRRCRVALRTRPMNRVTEFELLVASRLDALARTYPTFKKT